ncbi:MAG: DUF1801 domain-containing protein [Planctomycetota bacterium]
MQSKAKTVAEYLASMPADRRAIIGAVRDVILKNLDKDYEEGMHYGMIGYCVPHRVFPAGYHCDEKQPLPFAALASQKNYMSVYLMGVYAESGNEHATWFREAWLDAGKKIDMGKCCVRFKKLEDVALTVLGEAIRRMPVQRYVAMYAAALEKMRSTKKPAKEAAKKAPPKRAASRKKKTKPAARQKATR